MFLITSTEFVKQTKKPVSSMIKQLLQDDNAIGVHASLTEDSTTYWNHLKNRSTKVQFRQTFFIDNICSLYRADWFNSIGRFDKELTYAWGIDVETCYLARKSGRTIWIDESIQVRKETNVGYKMKRMNMTSNKRERLAQKNMDLVLGKKYGPDYWRIMNTEYVTDQMR